jgi:hypothetical protein
MMADAELMPAKTHVLDIGVVPHTPTTTIN